MPLKLADKKAIVSEVNQVAKDSLSAVIADYHGLSVEQLTTLRNQARASNVYLRVVKNTLATRAVEGTDFECMKTVLIGPTILAFSRSEPGSAARVFKAFAKDNEQFEVKALSIGGDLLAADQIDMLAKLPTRDEAIAMLMRVIQAPVVKLAQTLNEVPSKLVRVIAAIRDQKQ